MPAFKNIETNKLDPLNASLKELQDNKTTLLWQIGKLPAGSTNLMGDSLKQYVAGQIDKDKLFEEIEKAIISKAKK